MAKLRKIIHVDMDAFYASVEQRDNPVLRGRPVVVGGRPDSRGVVAAASYEARKYGVHSAISCAKAQRLCPYAVFVAPRMEHYREVSQHIRDIFRQVTDRIEPLSLDEAYLDVTENALGEPLASKIAQWIRMRIRIELSLTASAGVGPSKLVAKIASDCNKPDGLKVVPPDAVESFLAPLPVERIWGVGPVTAKRLHELDFKTIKDLRGANPEVLEKCFGKHGVALARLACGQDERQVQSSRRAKSQGCETTFATDVSDIDHLASVVEQFSEALCVSLARIKTRARAITLKLRYDDFTTITRSRSLRRATRMPAKVITVANALLYESTEAGRRPVRLIGVSASGFVDDNEPEQLWFDAKGFE